MGEEIIWQSAITLFVPLKEGEDNIKALQSKLREAQNDVENNGIIPFSKIDTIHFIRFLVIDNAKDQDLNLLPPGLLLSSNFDGTPEGHIEELCSIFPEGIDSIYGHCIGYPNNPDHSTRVTFLLKHRIKEKLFWPGLRGTTRNQVYKDDELFRALQNHIDQENLGNLAPRDIHSRLMDFVKSRGDLNWALEPEPKPSWWFRFKWRWGYWQFLILAILLIVTSFIPLIIWVLYARLLEISYNKKKLHTEHRTEEYQQIVSLENQVLQNQFSVYGTIKKPQWYKRVTVELVLWAFRWNGKYGSSEGVLGGIDSIHFARWIIFNGGNNMMFMSNYDTSWENYFSEFVNRSSGPMNLTFGSMIGYPPIKWLIGQGAKNELEFKRIARLNQYMAELWYSGYPHLSAKNIQNTLRIRQFLSKTEFTDKELTDWLRRF